MVINEILTLLTLCQLNHSDFLLFLLNVQFCLLFLMVFTGYNWNWAIK